MMNRQFTLKRFVLLLLSALMLFVFCACGKVPANNAQNNTEQNSSGVPHVPQVDKPEDEWPADVITVSPEGGSSGFKPSGSAKEIVLPKADRSGKGWSSIFSSTSTVYGVSENGFLVKNGETVYSIDASGGSVRTAKNDTAVRKTIQYDQYEVPFARYEMDGKYFFADELQRGFNRQFGRDWDFTLFYGEAGSSAKKMSGDFELEPLFASKHELGLESIVNPQGGVISPDGKSTAYIARLKKNGSLTSQYRLYVEMTAEEQRLATFKIDGPDVSPQIYWLDNSRFILEFQWENYPVFLADISGKVQELSGTEGYVLHEAACGSWAAFETEGSIELRRISGSGFEAAYRVPAEETGRICYAGFTQGAEYFFCVLSPKAGQSRAEVVILDLASGSVKASEIPGGSWWPQSGLNENCTVSGCRVLMNCYSADFGKSCTLLLDMDKIMN